MKIESIGYGAGQRDLEQQPNLLRLLVGEALVGEAAGDPTANPAAEQVWLLETNLDDASGELIGYALDKLWQAGALDVVTTPVQMKKNRPGVTLSVLCQAGQCDALEAILFRETTTLGVRRQSVWRHTLSAKHIAWKHLGGRSKGCLPGWMARPTFPLNSNHAAA